MNAFFETIITKIGLADLWYSHYDISVIKIIFLGALMLIFDFVLLLLIWFLNMSSMTEVGFPGRKKKYIRKITKSYDILSWITLIPLYIDSENRSFYSIICLITNMINVLMALISIVGYVGCIITHANGWCFTLLVTAGLASVFLYVIIIFIPDLIWLPSERRRYGLGRKNK